MNPAQRGRNVDLLHEAVVEDDAMKTGIEHMRFDPSFLRDLRDALDLHGQDRDPFVQHLVMLHVVQQCVRHAAGAR